MRVLLGLLLLLLTLGCPHRAREAPPPEEPKAISKLTWDYLAPAPEHFVIQRRLEGQAWEDVATIPGASGEQLTWSDTSLRPGLAALVVHYRVHAVVAGQRSPASNRVTTTIPAVPPPPIVPEGTACTVTQVTATAVTITCPLVTPSRYR